jgi:type IV secretion system protein VirD4
MRHKVRENKRTFFFVVCSVLMTLQMTSQLGTLFIGLSQWVAPLTCINLLVHHFYIEVLVAFLTASLLILSIFGIFTGGFYRYLSQGVIITMMGCLGLFLFGYTIFTWCYLDGFLKVSFNLFGLRFHEPELWAHFIKTECIVFFIVFSALAYYGFERIRPSRKVLGNAHFSNGFEMKQAGFFKKEEQSIIIGKKYGAPLYANGFEHVLVFAPTGSGKTRSIGIPNLLHYPYSVVCNDVKLTMFKTTSGFRERVLDHQCYCWAPASENRRTHRYNPLAMISDDKFQRITDIQRIAHILMPDSKKSDPI